MDNNLKFFLNSNLTILFRQSYNCYSNNLLGVIMFKGNIMFLHELPDPCAGRGLLAQVKAHLSKHVTDVLNSKEGF